MIDPAAGRRAPHLELTDFDVSLERGDGRMPLQPVVQRLRVRLSPAGLAALMQSLIDEAARRAPVGLALKDIRVGPDGIFLRLRVEKSILRSDLATRLALSAPGGNVLRVALTELDMPAWIPLDLLLDEAVKRGGSALRRDPGDRRALLLDPAALLARFGVPGRFAPGEWDVATSDAGIELGFREFAPGA
jgi:hypothetical protein